MTVSVLLSRYNLGTCHSIFYIVGQLFKDSLALTLHWLKIKFTVLIFFFHTSAYFETKSFEIKTTIHQNKISEEILISKLMNELLEIFIWIYVNSELANRLLNNRPLLGSRSK